MNRKFTAPELVEAGLISRLIPAENFLPDVIELATNAAKFSAEAIKTTKKLIRGVDKELLEKVNDEEIDRLIDRMTSDDSIESVMNFVGKSLK
jgi:peroxisomal 3,2-trans-enoyl-CoA isomerase